MTAASLLLFTAGYAGSENIRPQWMRMCSISPDGKEIAFTYKGDIFVVPTEGGRARQITSNPAYDTAPVWSPDGKTIAFASDRKGSFDVYTVSREGGIPFRVTTHSGSETPVTFADDSTIIFKANIMPSVNDSKMPSGSYGQMYSVSVKGGRPEMTVSMLMEDMKLSPDGRQALYHDRKGPENAFRKHHTSSVARDIWSCGIDENGKPYDFRKITDFSGEDRNPVWDGNSAFFYLSEKDGSFNVYRKDLKDGNETRVSFHKDNPVRFLSRSDNGILCYGYDGEIYISKEENGKWNENKVNVSILRDETEDNLEKEVFRSGVRGDFAVSPDGKEIAFVLRGDVYVTSVEYETTKRITNTAEQERSVDFAPDGRSVVYASERDGVWQIYMSSIVRKDEKQFCYATEINEKKLTNSNITSFQPMFSPDGKEVAFIEDRSGISVVNIESGKVRNVMDKKYQYSYSDGDQWYQWSPDGKWILTDYIGNGGWNNKDVALVKADGSGETHNLTESGYTDGNAKWVLDGKAMIWFSDRAGYRSHGSWGAQNDVYMMFFDVEAYEKFRMSEEELALYEEKTKEENEQKADEKNSDGKKAKRNKKDSNGKKEGEDEKESVFEPDLENCRDRIVRLTLSSGTLADAYLSEDGETLYYITKIEGSYDLWTVETKTGNCKQLVKGIGSTPLVPDKSGKALYLCTNGSLGKLNLASASIEPVSFKADFDYRPAEEREYMFDHVWRQVKDKFYVEDLHGVDWDMYRDIYRKYLPHINNNRDFADVLSELLGELNASHTGASYMGGGSAAPTAELGMFFDEKHEGDGLLISEIIKRSPADLMKTDLKKGCIIEAIDGEKILAGMDYFPLLEGKAGKNIRLSVYDPSTGKRFEESIKAINKSALSNLLYRRWVDRCEETVEKMSDGKVGYIHLSAMDSPSFREMYSRLLGKYRDCEAVIVDTRFNGGGWLHDDVLTLLSGKTYQKFIAHGQFIGNDPFNKWCKPSCMLVCEGNYSNAHGTPWLYQELGIGKIIGAPVPGTMTAVWWENLIDPTLVFGIPEVGCVDMNGNYAENMELEPDIEVYNSPQGILDGRDEQLEAAVRHMLETIGK